MDAFERLKETYRSEPEIGLVLGAGVSVQSGVPPYAGLARRVVDLAESNGRFDGPARQWAARLRELPPREMPPPEEIFTFVRARFDDRNDFHRIVREGLYRSLPEFEGRSGPTAESADEAPTAEGGLRVERRKWHPRHKTVPTAVYQKNPTLDAVISFCAADPTSEHARPTPLTKLVCTNRRVGAVLTTNYDNLVEASFGTKYGARNVLRPVGRATTEVGEGALPVYHCHGYIKLMQETGGTGDHSSDLLIAEEDYYEASLDPDDFGNAKIREVIGSRPCVFVGSAMTDRNLRRHLHHHLTSTGGRRHQHFALLPRNEVRDQLTYDNLRQFGVSVICVENHAAIPEKLRELYLCVDGVDQSDWQWVSSSASQRRGTTSGDASR